MQYSVGVEYALHSLFYMIDIPEGKTVNIHDLAQLHKLPESYLSKIFTKLKKGNIVKSSPGVKGGYVLARDAHDISFWDVIEAVEGSQQIFKCAEIRQNNLLNPSDDGPHNYKAPCFIKTVMGEAEEQMRNYLREKSIYWLTTQVKPQFDEKRNELLKEWVEEVAH